jgi:hypothetical protein
MATLNGGGWNEQASLEENPNQLHPEVVEKPAPYVPGANGGVNPNDLGQVPPPGKPKPITVTDKNGNSKTFFDTSGPKAGTTLKLPSAVKAVDELDVNNIKARALNTKQYDAGRAASVSTAKAAEALTPTLQAATMGQVPSAAQIQSRALLNQQSLAQARAAAAIRGGATPYAAQRALTLGLGSAQAPVIAQGGQARAAELTRAQDVLAQSLASQRAAAVARMGSDANVANSNANLKQGASVQNQANALKVGTANLGNAVQAQQLDSAAQLQMAIEQQRQGLLSQEAKDQRTLGNANLGLTQAQYQAQKANAANQAYLDQINLELEQQQLAARAKMGVYGLQQQQTANDRALLAGITGGIAAPLGALAINLGQSSSTPTATPTAAPIPTPVFGMQLGLSPNLTTPTQLASSVGA